MKMIIKIVKWIIGVPLGIAMFAGTLAAFVLLIGAFMPGSWTWQWAAGEITFWEAIWPTMYKVPVGLLLGLIAVVILGYTLMAMRALLHPLMYGRKDGDTYWVAVRRRWNELDRERLNRR